MHRISLRFLAGLLAAGVLAAQEPAPVSIKVDVSLINAAFIVRDASGALRHDITKDEIEVFEDGIKQEVRFFGRSNDLPLRLALVADASGSQEKFIQQHRRDLETFIRASITPRDHALLVCFGNHIRVVSDFSSSADEMMHALERFHKGDRHFPELEPDETRMAGTALFDAMYLTAMEKLRPALGERKALILFSDGEDNSSAHDLLDAIEAAQTADSLIYTVRYTESKHGRLTSRNRYGIREMDRLAGETGGAAFDASRKDLASLLAQVGEELRALYDIGYMSTNPVHDGTFRKVVIQVRRAGMTVRTKPGYYAR
ncbi:MAG: VWA domain-containing protein [Acidobacteriota bacterium]